MSPVAPLDFGILGPLSIHRGPVEITLRSSQQRKVLGVLLVNQRAVTTDELIDALWGETPPTTARGTLQTHVSRLRLALGGGPDLLPSDVSGYRLDVDTDRIDARRFERLVAGATGAADADGAASRARALLSDALSLWRGPALTDFRYEPFAQFEITRLEGLRLAAIERRIDLDLALGRNIEVCGELEILIEAHPLREELHGQLMVALYRSGRQAEALAVYHRLRERLVEELGIEPTPRLQALEQRVLQHSLDLDPERPAVGPATPGVPAGDRGADPIRPIDHIDVPALDARMRCELLLARGAGQRRAGSELEARSTYAAAVRLAAANGSREQLAAAALGLAGPPEDTRAGEPLDEVLMERAIAALPGDRPLVAMLRARLAVALIDRGEVDRGHRMADGARALARSGHHPEALAYTLRARHRTWFDPAALDDRLAIGSELIELGDQLGDPEVSAWGHRWRAIDLLEAGELAAYESELDALEELAANLHDAFHWWGVIVRRAGLALAQGPPDKAEPLVMEALALAGQIRSPYTLGASMLAYWALRWHQGRLDEIEDAVVQIETSSPAYAFVTLFLYRELDDRTRAAQAYERVDDDDFARLLNHDRIGVVRLFALVALADVAWYLRDPGQAAQMLDALSPFAGRWAVIHPGITPVAAVDHALGQLHALAGDRARSEDHYEAALAQCRDNGAVALEVRVQISYAEMLVELGDSTDQQHVDGLLSAANTTATEHGLGGALRLLAGHR